MPIDRIDYLLEILSKNPHQSADSALDKLYGRYRATRHERGSNGETIAQFLVKQISFVTRTTPVNRYINGLDCDFMTEFINIQPVNVQVKNSPDSAHDFEKLLNERRQSGIYVGRWAVICLDIPFENIKKDFIYQVKDLEKNKIT